MGVLEEVQGLYGAYREQVAGLERARKPWEGVFGFGGPQSHPCHEQFSADLERLLQAAAAQPLPSEEARALLDYIYFPAPDRRERRQSDYWMRVAVHGLTLELIPLLCPEDARALYDRYQRDYPRRERLPVQETVLDTLRQRGNTP